MKQSTTHNIVAFTCLVSFLATSLLLSKTHQEFDVVEAMRKQVEETEKTTDGKICKIKCTFELADDKLVQENTKVYFSDYRRKPEFEELTHTSPAKTTKVVEAFYNASDKNSLVLVHRDPESNKKLLTETVSFNG